jgi:WD40 repeat protein
MLLGACADRSIQSWNVTFTPGQPLPAEFGQPGLAYTHDAAANDVTIAADNATFYSASADKTVKVWKLASDNPVKNLPHPQNVDSIAFNKDGTILATGCHDGNVRLFDVAKGTQLKQIAAHTKPAPVAVYGVAFSPDGKTVASAGYDQALRLWDVTTGNMVREFLPYKEKTFEKGHRDAVYCLAFSPDGKLLASGGVDKTIKLWDVATGAVVRELTDPAIKPAPGNPIEAHPGAVYSVRFSADGKQLVSAGQAPRVHGHIAAWNVVDGKLLGSETLPLGTFYSMVMSPDGKTMAVAAGPRGRSVGAGLQEGNPTYILKIPGSK